MDVQEVRAGSVAVGLDGSPSSTHAFEQAIDIAAAEHRPLLLVHAVGSSEAVWTDPSGHDNRPGLSGTDTPGLRLVEEARVAALDRSPGLDVHTLLLVADPRDVLLGVSRRAWLLVLGSRGRGRVRSMLLGSTGVAVTRAASCPVLVVRPHHPGVVRNGVLVGVDGDGDAVPALEFAFAECARRRLPLTVVHVVPRLPHSVAEPYVMAVSEDEMEQHRVWVAEAMSGLREQHPDVGVRTEVVVGTPHDELVRRAEHMDLVVVGAHRGGLVSEVVLGSTAASVLERAHAPVAVVPVPPEASEAAESRA
jgi:nucleotide-binding universal stress UspA family protein